MYFCPLLYGSIITWFTIPKKFDSCTHLITERKHLQNHFFFSKWFEEQRKMCKTQKSTFFLKISILNIIHNHIGSFVWLMMDFCRLRFCNLEDYKNNQKSTRNSTSIALSTSNVNLHQLPLIVVLLSTQKVYGS